MEKINQVIIWGFPLHSHTHSYIHYGWHKAFTHLGYKTHWFHNSDYPLEYDYNNTLFITEGYADKNIPLNSTSVYFVHMCINPDKYLNIGARLIDIRFNVKHIKDCNYWFSLEDLIKDNNVEKISDVSYYQVVNDTSALRREHNNPRQLSYEAIYTSWATDLLPDEFDYDNIDIERSKDTIYYIGSIGGANSNTLKKFATEANANGIKFQVNNPWKNPISFEDNMNFMKKSVICPDIRGEGDLNKIQLGESGTCHKQIGYIPCRILKAISYGCLGITNSEAVYNLLEQKVIYASNENDLFHLAMKYKNDKDLIRKQMNIVREKHTYLNRANDIITVVNKK